MQEIKTRFLEAAEDFEMQIAFQTTRGLYISDEANELKAEHIICDRDEEDIGCRDLLYELMIASAIQQSLAHLVRISIDIDRNRDLDAANLVSAHPILDHARNEVGIGHDHGRAIKGFDLS